MCYGVRTVTPLDLRQLLPLGSSNARYDWQLGQILTGSNPMWLL